MLAVLLDEEKFGSIFVEGHFSLELERYLYLTAVKRQSRFDTGLFDKSFLFTCQQPFQRFGFILPSKETREGEADWKRCRQHIFSCIDCSYSIVLGEQNSFPAECFFIFTPLLLFPSPVTSFCPAI